MHDVERQVLGSIGDLPKWEDRGDRLWRLPYWWGWQYVLFSPDRRAHVSGPVGGGWHPDELAGIEMEIRGMLQARLDDSQLPGCVAPGCAEKGRQVYRAAERGRLAGRPWQRGDEIRLCRGHGWDVMMAQGQSGDELPDWLRADAKPSALAKLDAELDPLLPPGWLDQQAQIMRLAQRVGTP